MLYLLVAVALVAYFGVGAIPALLELDALVSGSLWGLGVLLFVLVGVCAEVFHRARYGTTEVDPVHPVAERSAQDESDDAA